VLASSKKCTELTERVGKGGQDWPPVTARREHMLNKLFAGKHSNDRE
jgi:hypothetical protein